MSSRFLRNALVLSPFLFGTIVALGACGQDRTAFVLDDASPPQQSLIGSDGGLSLADVDAGVCLSDTLGAVPVALAMMLVMDRSGSMTEAPPNSKWDQARRAMIAFADTKGAAGAKLGLTVFPPDPGPGDQCAPSAFGPIVPIALLPGNAPAIKAALTSREATGGTPMGAALQGGVDSMKTFLSTHTDEEGVIILVTDGDPAGCLNDDVAHVASVAAVAASGPPRIRTFVVGMQGATFASLDTIAQAGGGAPKAFNASGGVSDAGATPQQQLLDALDAIRSGALGCTYVLPRPDPSKGVLDPASVAIDFTPGKNDPTNRFHLVDNEAACGATTGGFYYDDPKAPTRIILCQASCEAVRNGTVDAKLDVVLGCIRQVN
ncbi:MAG: hypothetical protein JWO86_6206 [Myxococcaceae bacterium]|nr:hypothetical protein [Myxococcaceae bacterium]